MLDCTHHRYAPIRKEAKMKQAAVASALLEKSKSAPHVTHCIQQFCHASWCKDSPSVHRLWLGRWNKQLLSQLMRQSLTDPLIESDRQLYIKIARKLTAPLLNAYYHMLDISTNPSTTPTTITSPVTNAATSTLPVLTPHVRAILEATHDQHVPLDTANRLEHLLDTIT